MCKNDRILHHTADFRRLRRQPDGYYAASGILRASYSSLSTIGSLFSNILLVFIGLMLAGFCGGTIGTLLGSITLCLMSFGLQAIFSAERGSAISLVFTGVFVLVINTVSSQGCVWIAAIKKGLSRPEAAAQAPPYLQKIVQVIGVPRGDADCFRRKRRKSLSGGKFMKHQAFNPYLPG